MSLLWKAKAITQKAISFLPYSNKVNYLFQRYVTKGVFLDDEHLRYKLEHARDHIHFLRKYGAKATDNEILELGTGWYPIIPICFYLKDLGQTTSIDIQLWLNKENILTTLQKLEEWKNKGLLTQYLDSFNQDKWEQLIQIINHPLDYDLNKIKDIIGLHTLVTDARKTNIPSQSIDFVCSNNTFEHIHKNILIDILIEFKRVLKTNGIMSHFIDLSDHFAHFDKSITIYNFLKFSQAQWKMIDNSIQPQNRMRFKDYKVIYEDLQIPITEEQIREGNIEELSKVKVHRDYAKHSKEELAISHGYVVSSFN